MPILFKTRLLLKKTTRVLKKTRLLLKKTTRVLKKSALLFSNDKDFGAGYRWTEYAEPHHQPDCFGKYQVLISSLFVGKRVKINLQRHEENHPIPYPRPRRPHGDGAREDY
jgi:hypothetical protein